MNFIVRRTWALVLAVSMLLVLAAPITGMAAQKNIEIVLTDITEEYQQTLSGEAKIKVSVKGAKGNVTAVQTALKFSGNMEYKSIDFLVGENNPPECFYIPPNTALANNTGKLLPGIVTDDAGAMTFTEEETDLFILTFIGEVGCSVSVSINDESSAGTYCAVDGSYITFAEGYKASVEADASIKNNKGIEAVVKLIMDKVDTFAVSNGSGYVDSKITLTITNEDTGSTISTVLNTVSDKKGGHYDGVSSVPTFIVKNTVLEGETYTVELSGSGYIPYKKTHVTFEEPLVLTNQDFVPGDVNADGMVDAEDKLAYQEIKNGNYSDYEKEYADFNRDGKVDRYDDIFDGIDVQAPTKPGKIKNVTLAATETQITVSWQTPSTDGGTITKYIIKYGTSSLNLDKKIEINDPTAVSKVITDVTKNGTYYIQIAAENEIGLGDFSDVKSIVAQTPTSGGGGGGGGGGSSDEATDSKTEPDDTQKEEDKTVTEKPDDEDNQQGTSKTFTDLGKYAWAEKSIYTLKNAGIINGVSETEYAPANNIKRGDFILILVKMLNIDIDFTENFEDVPKNSYYYDAIGKAKAMGIASGDGISYMPENSITREDLITLAYRAFLNEGYIEKSSDTSVLDKFGDKDKISGYAVEAMASMVKAGIISGSDGNVNPKGNATRAEVAVMCEKLLGEME